MRCTDVSHEQKVVHWKGKSPPWWWIVISSFVDPLTKYLRPQTFYDAHVVCACFCTFPGLWTNWCVKWEWSCNLTGKGLEPEITCLITYKHQDLENVTTNDTLELHKRCDALWWYLYKKKHWIQLQMKLSSWNKEHNKNFQFFSKLFFIWWQYTRTSWARRSFLVHPSHCWDTGKQKSENIKEASTIWHFLGGDWSDWITQGQHYTWKLKVLLEEEVDMGIYRKVMIYRATSCIITK